MSEEHPGRKPLVRAQQEKYAQNIAAGMPKCEAARAAGYSGTGSVAVAKLNKKIHVLERINFLKREAGNAVQVTSSEVVQGILDSIERSKAANQEGHVLKGLELLGKTMALFTDKNLNLNMNQDLDLDARLRNAKEMARELTSNEGRDDAPTRMEIN